MLYEFITYPHEVCYRPKEQFSRVHGKGSTEFLCSVIDDFSFKGQPFLPSEIKTSHDDFDKMCYENEDCIKFAYSELKNLLDVCIDSLGYGTYYAILHNKDLDENGINKKAHFHILFDIPRGEDFSIQKVYELLGMFRYLRDDFRAYNKDFVRYIKDFPSGAHSSRLNKYEDYCRSSRLRYLCHLDNKDKYPYSMTDVITNGNYIDNPDVIAPSAQSPFAIFLGLRQRYKLNDEVDWFEWLAQARLSDDVRKSLSSIKTDIHRYYVAFYYRLNKNIRSYS